MGQKVYVVKAPVTGIFYRAPSPVDPPFVREEKRVAVGDVVCIVESMKVFTEVRAERAGVVKRILVEDQEEVRINQPLIEIELD